MPSWSQIGQRCCRRPRRLPAGRKSAPVAVQGGDQPRTLRSRHMPVFRRRLRHPIAAERQAVDDRFAVRAEGCQVDAGEKDEYTGARVARTGRIARPRKGPPLLLQGCRAPRSFGPISVRADGGFIVCASARLPSLNRDRQHRRLRHHASFRQGEEQQQKGQRAL